jgi:hypothetical protein
MLVLHDATTPPVCHGEIHMAKTFSSVRPPTAMPGCGTCRERSLTRLRSEATATWSKTVREIISRSRCRFRCWSPTSVDKPACRCRLGQGRAAQFRTAARSLWPPGCLLPEAARRDPWRWRYGDPPAELAEAEEDPAEGIDCPLAPDAEGKAGEAECDFYSVRLPDLGADTTLRGEVHNTSFVNYLRPAFRWGGFPGWEQYKERPEKALARLTAGLLPF